VDAFVSKAHSDENWYRTFRTLLEACRSLGDSEGASHVQALMDSSCLLSSGEAVATTRLQGSEQ